MAEEEGMPRARRGELSQGQLGQRNNVSAAVLGPARGQLDARQLPVPLNLRPLKSPDLSQALPGQQQQTEDRAVVLHVQRGQPDGP